MTLVGSKEDELMVSSNEKVKVPEFKSKLKERTRGTTRSGTKPLACTSAGNTAFPAISVTVLLVMDRKVLLIDVARLTVLLMALVS